MSTQYQIEAFPRKGKGKSASRGYRRDAQIPAVIYGGSKDNENVLLNHNEIMRNLEVEGFQSAIIEIKTDKGSEQAILRDVQMHPWKPQVLHVDFQRVSATEKIRIDVPLHFLGGDQSPGVYNEGGIEAHLINEVEVECLPADLPEYLEVDISHLGMQESAKLSEIKVPEGVTILALAQEGADDLPVATIMAPQREEVEEVEGEEVVEGVEAEAPEGEEAPPEDEG
jgi:large subunit ribosomal protein L25